MKYAAKLVLVSLALAIPAILSAQPARELYQEANKVTAEADKKLNLAYEQLIKSIRADNSEDRAALIIERLRESQRAWLKYRDAQVVFVGTHADVGSASSRAAGMALYSSDLTEQRVKDLKDVPNPF